jgi:hypothetical protein
MSFRLRVTPICWITKINIRIQVVYVAWVHRKGESNGTRLIAH